MLTLVLQMRESWQAHQPRNYVDAVLCVDPSRYPPEHIAGDLFVLLFQGCPWSQFLVQKGGPYSAGRSGLWWTQGRQMDTQDEHGGHKGFGQPLYKQEAWRVEVTDHFFSHSVDI